MASINDLLSSASRAVTKKIDRYVPLSHSMMPHANYEVVNPPVTGIKQQRTASRELRTPVSAYREHSELIDRGTNETESIMSGGTSLVNQLQGGEPPSTLQTDMMTIDEPQGHVMLFDAREKEIQPPRAQSKPVQIKLKDLKTVS